MRRARRLVPLAVTILVLLLPASAAAFPLTTCTANLTALAADGTTLGSISSGADDATMANPFHVRADGTVAYDGSSGGIVFGDFTWAVSVFGIPTPLSGGGSNDEGSTTANGFVGVGENLPISVVGLFFVSGYIRDADNSCAGSGWFYLEGDALGSILFWIALGLLLVGLVFIFLLGGWFFGILGGLLFGAGGAGMAIVYAVMPAAEWTPLAALILGLVLGLLIVFLRRDSGPAPA